MSTTSNKIKHQWFFRSDKSLTLKQFARKVLKEGNEVAKLWFANKAGDNNEERSDKNKTRIEQEKVSSKSSGKSKK